MTFLRIGDACFPNQGATDVQKPPPKADDILVERVVSGIPHQLTSFRH